MSQELASEHVDALVAVAEQADTHAMMCCQCCESTDGLRRALEAVTAVDRCPSCNVGRERWVWQARLTRDEIHGDSPCPRRDAA